MKPKSFLDVIMQPIAATLGLASAVVLFLIGQSDFHLAENCVKGSNDYLYYTVEGWMATGSFFLIAALMGYLLILEIVDWW